MIVTIFREGTITFRDTYDVPEINEKTLDECINDEKHFVESEMLYETWTPTGNYTVVNEDDEVIVENVED